MADIFLSYKRKDRDKVRPLVEALQAQSWSVWWDTRIGVGETWDEVIEDQLKEAKCVVVVWSKLSVDSRWVRSEAHEGLERNCLVPVKIENAKPPLAFKLIQTTDLSHWRGDGADAAFTDLAAGVRRLVGRPRVFVDGTPQADQDPVPVGEIDPKDAQAYRKRGESHFKNKDYDRAIADFTNAIRIDPKYAPAYYNRGRAYREKVVYDRAIADFTKAIEIDPKYAWAYTERGSLRSAHRDNDGAIADFNKAIEIDPKGWAANFNRGLVHMEKGDYDGAIADFTKSIEINPTFSATFWYRAATYRLRKRSGDLDCAMADETRRLEINRTAPAMGPTKLRVTS